MNKPKILIVDDTTANIKILADVLKEDYKVYVVKSGKEALEYINTNNLPDLILLDIVMPDMDGYQVCQKLKANELTKNIPIIFITAVNDDINEEKGLDLGAVDYITKPFSIPVVKKRVSTHIQLKQYKDYLEQMVKEQTKIIEDEKNNAIFLQKKAEQQLELFLLTLASAIESKDKYTGGHVERVANYSKELASALGLKPDEVRKIYLGAIVHDLGKIGVKDSILNKNDKLDYDEFNVIKEHTIEGYKLLGKIEEELMKVAASIALFHQEKWDGTGYPYKLKETQIPLEARIVKIADYWDAITTDRPYREALKLKDAITLMYSESGKSFDPELLKVFMNENKKIYLKYIPISKLKELA